VEILTIFKGTETRKNIRIWGDNGFLCRPSIRRFGLQQTYVLSLFYGEDGTKGIVHPQESATDYYLSICGEHWLKADPNRDLATGRKSFLTLSAIKKMYPRFTDLGSHDHSEIFRLVLETPELQDYFHPEAGENRQSISIVYPVHLTEIPVQGLNKFGHPVSFWSEAEMRRKGLENYLHLKQWQRKEKTVDILIHYPLEGVWMELKVQKKGKTWTRKKQTLWER
ncbi:MAG: hypothetical protein AAF206_13335, partial [Bacteroidota bacterium]